jgi:hypothetical protein
LVPGFPLQSIRTSREDSADAKNARSRVVPIWQSPADRFEGFHSADPYIGLITGSLKNREDLANLRQNLAIFLT